MKINTTQISVGVATIATIAINALANILPFNGITTGAVSDKIQSYFVPAGYVFAIWGLIYLALVIFSFGYSYIDEKNREYMKEIFPLYLFSCVLNCVWIVLWHYGFFLTTVVVMLALLVTLIMIYEILKKNLPTTLKEKLIIHTPFSIYLAWICVATIANISGVLWLLNWGALGISGPVWAAIMMGVAGILAVATAFIRKDVAFSLVILWALVGIMVKFPTQMIMQYAGIGTIGVILLAWVMLLVQTMQKKRVPNSK